MVHDRIRDRALRFFEREECAASSSRGFSRQLLAKSLLSRPRCLRPIRHEAGSTPAGQNAALISDGARSASPVRLPAHALRRSDFPRYLKRPPAAAVAVATPTLGRARSPCGGLCGDGRCPIPSYCRKPARLKFQAAAEKELADALSHQRGFADLTPPAAAMDSRPARAIVRFAPYGTRRYRKFLRGS